MSKKHPFFTNTGSLDFKRVFLEIIPLVKIGVFIGFVSIFPLLFGFLFQSTLRFNVFILITQSILTIGSGLVLLYIVSRAIQIADE